MASEVRAVIDVGTNSVKFLVAAVDGALVRPLDEGSEQTRLGQGFYETHILQPAAVEHTAAAVAEFAKTVQVWKPFSVRVIATSAARDARNAEDLLGAIQKRSGLRVNVISGEQEADWAFEGVASDPQLAPLSLLVADFGGGSTEFTTGRNAARRFGRSFQLGTVRFLEKNPLKDMPLAEDLEECLRQTKEILEREVRPALGPALKELDEVNFISTGGTGTIIARIHRRLRSFNRELIDGAILSRAEVTGLMKMLWGMRLDARRNIIGLPPNRADVILPGVVFVDQVMEVFNLAAMRISTRGLRFGALMH